MTAAGHVWMRDTWAAGSAEGDQPRYLIWSNQHGMWWRPDRTGYTHLIEAAGRYRREDAQRIVSDVTVAGRLVIRRRDSYTGRELATLDEYAILAPEHTEQVT